MLTCISLFITIGLYLSIKWCYTVHKKAYLSPLILTPLVIIAALLILHISYDSYNSGAQWLSAMLQPATMALAVPLYKYRALMKKHLLEIITGVLSGSVIAMASSAGIAECFHVNHQLWASLIPHSITTPIAMEIAPAIGGIPAIAAVLVIITGLLGAMIGPILIKCLQIKSTVARGVLFGTGAHAVGTAKAFEFGADTGTFSSLSMIIAALVTVCAIPVLTAIK